MSHECPTCGDGFDTWRGVCTHHSLAHDDDSELKDVLIDEIKRLESELGRTPTLDHVNDLAKYGQDSYISKFGTWNNALDAAGLEKNNEFSTRDDLLAEIERIAEEVNRTPRIEDLNEHGEWTYIAYSREFGSWNAALGAAGFSPNQNMKFTKTELEADLRRLESELGHTPTKQDLHEKGVYGYGTYKREYGSWNEALREAGVEPTNRKNIPAGEILNDVRCVVDELGRRPNRDEYRELGNFSERVIARNFGSWNGIIREIGLEVWDFPTGEDHPMWEGGANPYGVGWNERKKRKVRARDQARCQECGRTEPIHLEKFGTKHVVHHIQKARSFDDPEERNAMDNLVTLCRGKCHRKWEKVSPLRPQTASD